MGTLPLKKVLVNDQWTADPSAHVFDGQLYFYPSHDLDTNPPADNNGAAYGMKDFHVFSVDPADCSHIIDHGEVLNISAVSWALKEMWAPDAAFKNGKYYFYFPVQDKSGIFRVGATQSASPAGPFPAPAAPITGSYSIDPAVFVDDDGQGYMYFGGLAGGQLERWQTGTYNANGTLPADGSPALGPKLVKLGDDMVSFKGAISEISIVDANGKAVTQGDHAQRFYEGVWMHKFNGTYYLSYSTGDTHFLVYATSNSPSGPFKVRGQLLTPPQGWTTHHSIVQFNGKWYLFYHDAAKSGKDNNRNVKMQELVHAADGSIPTLSP